MWIVANQAARTCEFTFNILFVLFFHHSGWSKQVQYPCKIAQSGQIVIIESYEMSRKRVP